MKILSALVVLSVAAGVTPSEAMCEHPIHCPCGSTNKNVTVCTQEKRKDDLCSTWSKCKTCQDGLNRCLECPEGLEGPVCASVTGRKRSYRQKRQFYTQPSRNRRPWRPNSPNQANTYPTRSVQRGGDFCPELNSPKLGSIRCLTNEQQRTCVGTCLPGYSFEGRGSDHEITLTCTEGYYTPLREFPPCKSGGYCDLIVQGAGSFNCTTGMTGTQCDVICDNRYIGRYSCYPGREWQPPLPYCMQPKGVEEDQACRCEYGGNCDRNGNCVCPVGRTGRLCETIVPEKDTCSDPGFVTNGFRRNQDESDASIRRMFGEGEIVVYACESEEYALQGSSILTCKNDGKWSQSRPKCIRTAASSDTSLSFCKDPGVDPNGSRIPSLPPNQRGFPQGTQLQYSCNQGYDLDGEKNVFCLTSGEWLSQRPRCNAQSREPGGELVYCLNPGSFSNGRVVYYPPLNSRQRVQPETTLDDPQYPEGGRLEYSCDNGFSLEGSGFLTCEAYGGWSAEPPVCRRVSERIRYCKNPGPILNGKVVYIPAQHERRRPRPPDPDDNTEGYVEYPQGSGLQYSCDSGYAIDGTSDLTCKVSGRWSGEPPTCNCGRSIMGTTQRILHGNKTDAGDWPWVVAIAERGQVVCGGAILNTQTIITAAHCLPRGRSFTLYFGKHYRSNRLDDAEVLTRSSDRVIMHPDFRNDTLDSDIALITFKPKIKFSDRVQPICLPTGETTARNILPNRSGFITGWGHTEKRLESPELLMAHLPVLKNDACVESFRSSVPNFNLVLTRNMFCAGFSDARQSTCIGDSGSPMVFYEQTGERYTLEGLVSFGVEGQCGQKGTYSIFTKVNRFLPWIYRNI